MRVAFFDQTGDVIGGAQESLLLLLTHLPPDIEPVVVLFHEGKFADRVRAEHIRVLTLDVSQAVASSTRQKVQFRNLLQVLWTMLRIGQILQSLKADVVHTNTVKTHFLVLPIASMLRLPTVAHLRDILSGRALRALLFVLKHFAKRKIAISYSVERTYGSEKSIIVRNPVNLDLYASLPERSTARRLLGIENVTDTIFAIVGRVNKWKGHDQFLRAATNAIDRGTTAHFAIVGEPRFGDHDYLEHLKALVADKKLQHRIHFIPWQADLPTLYAAIDVLVNCSEKEPFGRTVIEAAAAGIPTICFDDAGVADFMKLAGLAGVVPAGNQDELAATISRYSTDENMRHQSGAAFKAWASTFDASVHAQAIATTLRSL